MLLHVILPRECLVADWTEDALLPRVLLPMTCSMPRGRERGRAAMACRVRTRVLVLSSPLGWGRVSRPTHGCLRRRRLNRRGHAEASLRRQHRWRIRVDILSNVRRVVCSLRSAHIVVGAIGGTGRGRMHGFRDRVKWPTHHPRRAGRGIRVRIGAVVLDGWSMLLGLVRVGRGRMVTG